MIKNIIYSILIICSLNANDDIHKATQLEMFLFKIGFTTLLNDFEKEKNTTKSNGSDIIELKANVKYILEQMNKNKLVEKDGLSVDQTLNNDELLKEIAILRQELMLLKSSINNKNTSPKIVKKSIVTNNQNTHFISRRDGVNVRIEPLPNSKVIRQLSLGENIEIDFCNKYGWCKIKDYKGYVAKFLINRF